MDLYVLKVMSFWFLVRNCVRLMSSGAIVKRTLGGRFHSPWRGCILSETTTHVVITALRQDQEHNPGPSITSTTCIGMCWTFLPPNERIYAFFESSPNSRLQPATTG
jgi:hypothetical protein